MIAYNRPYNIFKRDAHINDKPNFIKMYNIILASIHRHNIICNILCLYIDIIILIYYSDLCRRRRRRRFPTIWARQKDYDETYFRNRITFFAYACTQTVFARFTIQIYLSLSLSLSIYLCPSNFLLFSITTSFSSSLRFCAYT